MNRVESVSQVGPPSRGGPGRQPRKPHDAIPVCKVVRLGSPDLQETVSQVGPPSRGGPGRQPQRPHDAILVCKVVRLGSPDLLVKQSLRAILTAALLFAIATTAAAQPPARAWEAEPAAGSEFALGQPPVPYAPVTVNQDDCWVRWECFTWTATTRRGLELGQELSSNPLFNTLLESTGTSQTDLVHAASQNRIGYQLTLGKWLDCDQEFGVEASAFYFYRQAINVPLTSGDAARGLGPAIGAIGLPALAGGGGGTLAVPISSPLVKGVVNFELDNLLIYGIQAMGRARLGGSDSYRLDGLLGLRRLEVEGTLGINAAATALSTPLSPGTTVATTENIFAESVYQGPVIGFDWQYFYGPLDFGVRPQVQFAFLETTVRRTANAQAIFPNGNRALIDGGTFLAASGPQQMQTSGWTWIPELGLHVGCRLTDCIRLTAGTSAMIIPEASRTEGQLLFGLPPERLLPGTGGIPQVGHLLTPTRETLYVFTASLGIEFRF